uniref:Aa_trans domain-containing protein n=1 Tax=Panagrellus redivivus TaxID=6233 RepID=A0A7E4VXH9_PANRE
MLKKLNEYCNRNIDDAVWYPCPTQEKRPQFFFYETESTYVGMAISFAYVVTALLLYTFGMSDAELLVIPALLTNLPHLFRRFLEYVPLLFRQVCLAIGFFK